MKWYGKVGYAETVETVPGVWTERIVERPYYGDILRLYRRWQSTSKVNDDLEISNRISIVADPFAYENFYSMRYVEYMGARWKVSDVEVEQPRLILTLGGVYNGELPEETDEGNTEYPDGETPGTSDDS